MDHLGQFIQNHWQLSLAFVILSFLVFINEYLEMRKQGKTLSAEQAVELINHENAVVIDLRDPAAFKAGHIIGSIRASEADFETAKMNKYKNKTIILVCNKGIQAAAVAKNIRTKEFTNPMVLNGGIEAWKTASLPIIKK
ncbi:MAG: rhodanese-like domain-containing protein [Legionellaceae bacterium]|nr:rhodanese-like domain-containing protein [Legionellaceae bacterium]